MPALELDAAFVHVNRADHHGNGQVLGPDPYFDDLFLGAAQRRFLTAEKVVEPGRLADEGPLQSVVVTRLASDGVCEMAGGAHFTSCPPDYGRDEAFQQRYAKAGADATSWVEFSTRFLETDEAGYRAAVAEETAASVPRR